MSELSRLITRLQRGIVKNASYVKTIRHPHLLIVSLQELNDLIGNDKVKDSVAIQVSHLIMVKRRAMDNPVIKEDDVMLNTLFMGVPGVGKTLVATKLAKVWYALGYIDGSGNTTEKKQEITDMLKDLLKDTTGTGTTSDNTMVIYVMFFFIIILITILSIAWSFYNRFGGYWTLGIFLLLITLVLFVGYFVSVSLNSNNTTKSAKSDVKNNNVNGIRNKNDTNEYGNSPVIAEFPRDEDIITIAKRDDFVDRYVGWSAPKTTKFLNANLGKVVFVDEAYSFINGPHDEFGMESLTTINLFMSQHSKEIIIIFAGYKDLLESGPFSVQPGLKRRFMWQFDCAGYTPSQLFEIFKLQLKKKGWSINDEENVLQLFLCNADAFPAFGGDTERAAFFSELEHSREFIANESGLHINVLEARHIERGINKLRENNFQESGDNSSNPLANMMRLMANKKKKDVTNLSETVTPDDINMIEAIRDNAGNQPYR